MNEKKSATIDWLRSVSKYWSDELGAAHKSGEHRQAFRAMTIYHWLTDLVITDAELDEHQRTRVAQAVHDLSVARWLSMAQMSMASIQLAAYINSCR